MSRRPEENVVIFHPQLETTAVVNASSVNAWRRSGWILLSEKPVEEKKPAFAPRPAPAPEKAPEKP
jgi:hypothetical protein